MKVFISYSRQDESAVRSMVADLERARVQVWLDEELGGGDTWWTAILQEIRDCTLFIFAVSSNSLYSKPCRAELGYAQALGLPTLPVQIGAVSSYRADPIFSRQLIDYRTPTAATGFALMGALNEYGANRADLPDPLPEPPAIPYEYLQRLGASIHDPAMLTPPIQAQVVFELRNALHDENDPTVLDDIRDLLLTMRQRTDVTYPIASEIDGILGTDEPSAATAAELTRTAPPSTQSPGQDLPDAVRTAVERIASSPHFPSRAAKQPPLEQSLTQPAAIREIGPPAHRSVPSSAETRDRMTEGGAPAPLSRAGQRTQSIRAFAFAGAGLAISVLSMLILPVRSLGVEWINLIAFTGVICGLIGTFCGVTALRRKEALGILALAAAISAIFLSIGLFVLFQLATPI